MDIFWGKSLKIGQNQFLAEGFFPQKIEYVCICHGHPWVSGQSLIPTLTNYHLPLSLGLSQIYQTKSIESKRPNQIKKKL